MQDFRTQAAALWRQCSQIRRTDIFGPDDPLRPRYRRADLNWQADVVAPGFVGDNYRPGGLVILSVNPAGGNDEFSSDPLSEAVYRGFRDLRNAENALQAYDESNRAVLSGFPNWGSTARHCERILGSVGRSYDDIAFLYVVPFRTHGDSGTSMSKKYHRNGYSKHLRRQLTVLGPGHVIAIDRASEEAAEEFQEESEGEMKVTYYTRSYSAESERVQTLGQLSRLYSRRIN